MHSKTHTIPGNDLDLGILTGGTAPLRFSRKDRGMHLYVCGGTGTGKSKFLEHLIRQDIIACGKSKCGMLVLDPHGSLYDSLINWLAWQKMDRPVVPIDLRQKEWVVAYNMLRPRIEADPSVVVNHFVQAMTYVWGANGTAQTPLFARWASNILWTLYEKELTLLESAYLMDKLAKRMRYALTSDLSNRSLVQDWAYANSLTPKDFEAQISSTVNRLHSFLSTEMLRNIFGHSGASLDFSEALGKGQIVLVNLATEKARVSDEDSALFATLLLSDLWNAAKERGKGTDASQMKPFYVYIDEFQNFITPTIAKNLDQARGFGLHLTLANQFPRQILHAGANGAQVYESVMGNARSKVVFATLGEENLRPLALDLFMGVMNPDEIKHQLYSTKVMGYREELRTSYSRGTSLGGGQFTGTTESAGTGGLASDEDQALTWNQVNALSGGDSSTWTKAESETISSVLLPIMGKELSSVQFRTIEEQIFRAMAVLFDQKERHGVARLVGSNLPISIYTPNVQKMPGKSAYATRYIEKCYEKLPFARRTADVQKQLAIRDETFVDLILNAQKVAPISAKRRIR